MTKPFELSSGDYQRLIRTLQKIGASLNVDDILQHIIDAAVELCRADQVSIMLLDPKTQQEAKTLIRQAEQTDQYLDHYLNTLLSGAVQRDEKPFLTDDVTELFTQKRLREKYQAIAAILSVPLTLRENILGVINLISLDKKRVFRDRELHLLEILASQCAQFVENARLHESLFVETQRLRKEVRGKYAPHGIIGNSPKMLEVFALLERILPTDGRVLIEGESGTGKELIARVIHYGGPRKDRPFVAVDCGALPANLLESELFGYVRGAFTGATRDKKGLFE